MIKSYAKINIFLKITGRMLFENVNYHTLLSRFMLVKSLFDEIEITEGSGGFEVYGDFDCPMEKNTIFRAFIEILPFLDKEKQKYLNNLKVEVKKRIPSGGGLGGGSSNAASFLLWVNKQLELKWDFKKMCEIGQKVGSDVPFFLSEYEIADVSGRGENIQQSKEKSFEVQIVHPKIHCDTAKVYQAYAKEFYAPTQMNWFGFSNEAILKQSPYENNDLLKPVLKLYPSLLEYPKNGYFLSGSGSCFWKIRE
ncbi:putative 4-(cytidine 5'-diphospho)-2-C-methyl-D-erythritol kinase [Helicobacter pullorum MIT 98-5489]|uniref:4-(cytidine 5'-diphospho)-2-C-methyl-D-erythritol kinase n=1 Tax=Helicobacter pullorum MIT 98-5489 TaxID=537972 RepID=C5EYD0_9HELI|nr:4-(cytidine 5'-diphospho)-2-C-methyl-D-erythritol kinase [Helicobacter pullorum]EEQ62900.1 putative 4-(cytidine 5'-diphospho)-2-C-methyl-D-erythritol kinase [Helicobacter pullorum MIT 98-5489]OCR04561.1 4-(cytidine 5'-diphospho)-2-C-methyl-D-erythritol kinase [Helicobacter pullorum]